MTKWIKESDDCYTQGNYYKQNLSIFVRCYDFGLYAKYYEIVVKNTWTLKEKIISEGHETKTEAIKNLRKYIRENKLPELEDLQVRHRLGLKRL